MGVQEREWRCVTSRASFMRRSFGFPRSGVFLQRPHIPARLLYGDNGPNRGQSAGDGCDDRHFV